MSINYKNRKSINPLLKWLWDLLSLYAVEEITVPTSFPDQIVEIKDIMRSDTSGVVNSVLDFAIDAASVDYTIETGNSNLTSLLNDWLKDINSVLLGKITIGIKALAKEYFRERWKGGSLLLLRTLWEDKDGFTLPTKMWFLDGANIKVENGEGYRVIGEEKYLLKMPENKWKSLPSYKNEEIFIQKPYDSWNALYSTPFIIQRGLYKNLKLYNLINRKSEKIIGKALEYLLIAKKGTEGLAQTGKPEYTYSEDDLKDVKEQLKGLITDSKTQAGTPTYVTNFDTELEHFIPDYSKAISQALYSPIERRLLAGLGLIDIVEGTSANRRESILNPKPFIAEIKQAVSDFRDLIKDVILVAIIKNSESHRKYVNVKVDVTSSSVKYFITDSIRDHLRSMYDRGILSKQTYAEVCGEDIDFTIEVQRRKDETRDKLDEILYPPITQNVEKDVGPTKETIPEDKQGIEKKNFKGTVLFGAICKKCNAEFDYQNTPEASMGVTVCPSCKAKLTDADIDFSKVYEEAPYKKISELPESVKVLSQEAQSLWMRVFNESYSKGEDYARKVAWTVVKKVYKKVGNDWVKKSRTKGEDGEWIDLETSSVDDVLDKMYKLQQIEIAEKKDRLLSKLLKEENN